MRARASDFAKWADHGVEGWSFDDVLPTFKALENTPDGDDEFHGRSGPFPIRLRSYEELTTSLKAFIDAVMKARPSGAKGNYMKKISISSTMGPGVKISLASVGAGGAAA